MFLILFHSILCWKAFPTLIRYKLGLTPLTNYVVQLQVLDTIDLIGNSRLQQDDSPSAMTTNNTIQLPKEWNLNSFKEAWRFPSNAISLLPDWVKHQCYWDNSHNNSSTTTILVPLLDNVFHLVPTTYTSTILGISTEILQILSHYFISNNDFGTIRGVAICGEEGTGKTHLSLMIANLQRHLSLYATIYLDCKQLQSSSNNLSLILMELSKVFQDAYEQAPSLIVLDDLDFLTPNVWNNDDKLTSSVQQQQQQISPLLVHQAKVISDHLRFLWNEYCCFDELAGNDDDTDNATNRRIRILCTCKDKQSLHPSLRCCNKFDSFVSLPTRLEGKTRFIILKHMIQQQHSISSQVVEYQILETWLLQNRLEIEKYTDGYRPSDLYILSCRLIKLLHQVSATDGIQNRLCWNEIVQDFIPLSLRYRMNHHMSFIRSGQSIATKTWSDVGGLFQAKAILEECILRPIQFHKVYSNCPILKLPRGVLLYGPSGCGKTFLVSALADRCNLNFVTCKGPELLDKYIGASEAKVRQLFEQANAASPCLLFFDDFDALAPKRGSDNTGVTDRVVNQLLTFLDGVEVSGSIQDRIFIVAATSRPDKVDSALLRPGRLDRHIYIGLPEANDERNDVFATIARNYPLDEGAKHCIHVGLSSADNLLQGSIAKEKLAYFSPADLKAVLSTAYMEAINNQLGTSSYMANGSREKEEPMAMPRITIENLIHAFEETNPSMSSADYKLFQSMYKRFMRSDTKNPSSVDSNKLDDVDSSWEENGTRVVPTLETALR